MNDSLVVQPVTADRWPDLEALFGPHGAYAGCWCMFWRLPRREFNQSNGAGTKAGLQELVCENRVPGFLAYRDSLPVAWCSAGPREQFAALERSRILKRIDEQPVWSVVCFFVAKAARKQGTMEALLRGVIDHARQQGARIVEGYPIDTGSPKLAGQKLTSVGGYMGIASTFRRTGFVEVGQASETQLIMRYTIG